MTAPLLTIHQLGRRLDQGWLWRGVSFALHPQQRLGLVGPSGSGKTLLLRTLVHLDVPQEGDIEFEGRSLTQLSMPTYRTQVIYVPQRPTRFEGTAEHNLKMIFQLSSYQNRDYNRARILGYLDALRRKPAFLDLSAPKLSGGEGQILGLLRSLQLDPKVLLLDEPTASLDPETTGCVEALLEQWLRADSNRACIWTSHDPAQMERVTDQQLNLQEFMA